MIFSTWNLTGVGCLNRKYEPQSLLLLQINVTFGNLFEAHFFLCAKNNNFPLLLFNIKRTFNAKARLNYITGGWNKTAQFNPLKDQNAGEQIRSCCWNVCNDTIEVVDTASFILFCDDPFFFSFRFFQLLFRSFDRDISSRVFQKALRVYQVEIMVFLFFSQTHFYQNEMAPVRLNCLK